LKLNRLPDPISIVKGTIAVTIVIFLLFNSMGYYFIFELQKMKIRKEIRSQIEKKPVSFSVLTITPRDINPTFCRIGNNEIEFKGKRYDVIKEFKKGSTTVIYCIYDSKEERLTAAFAKVSNTKLAQLLLDHMVKIAMPPFSHIPVPSFQTDILFPYINIFPDSAFLLSWSPPPEHT
jgi:hypothetical protein